MSVIQQHGVFLVCDIIVNLGLLISLGYLVYLSLQGTLVIAIGHEG